MPGIFFRNELHATFLPYFDTQQPNFFSLNIICMGDPKIKYFNGILKLFQQEIVGFFFYYFSKKIFFFVSHKSSEFFFHMDKKFYFRYGMAEMKVKILQGIRFKLKISVILSSFFFVPSSFLVWVYVYLFVSFLPYQLLSSFCKFNEN